MKTTSEALIRDLIERTRTSINAAERLLQLPPNHLNWRSSPKSWSVLECMEHLNLYGDFYLPEIKSRMDQSKSSPDAEFRPGLLGDYFAKSMLPKEKLNKMKTFKDKNPLGSSLTKASIEHFIDQQQRMLTLLDQARTVSLNRTKTAISISRLIRLRLGDTFRVVIYHNERHIAQAHRVLRMKEEKQEAWRRDLSCF